MPTSDLVIIGMGGHAEVILEIALQNNLSVLGFLDDDIHKKDLFGYSRIGAVCDCLQFRDTAQFIVAIGDNQIRESIMQEYDDLQFATLIAPSAQVSRFAKINSGTVVMANATINSNTTIGRGCIINSGAIVEHDSFIHDFVHIAPNATLCGAVCVGKNTLIGAGSTVKNNTSICDNVIVGVQSAIVKDITVPGIYMGIPAKRSRS